MKYIKYLKFLLVGVAFGIVLSKAEVVSWYRIYEMFRFESFHMYGVIGSAVILGALIVQLVKRTGMRSLTGERITFRDKAASVPRYLLGGIFFGFGWAMVGACPGPMFILVGHGIAAIGVVILSAVLGTFVYGLVRGRLPH